MKNNRPAKQSHYAWVMPTLTVSNMKNSLALYQQAFAFSPLSEPLAGPDGVLMHAELHYRNQVIMLGPEKAFGCTAVTPASGGFEMPMSLYVYYEDVDDQFQTACSAGCEAIVEPENMFWGDRMAKVRDPDGYLWLLATNVAEFDPSNVPSE